MAETAAEEIKAPESVEKKLAQKSLTASFGEVPTYEFIKTLIASEKATTGAKEILKDAEQTKLDEAIKQTNTPNEELTKIINNPTELAKLTKEEINKLQERFKTLNK